MPAVDILVALLMVAGLVGSVVPFIPGTPLILAGALIYAFATDFAVLGLGRLLLLTAMAALGVVLSHVAGAVGARRSGGSRYAVIGAIVGSIAGLFFPPVGLLVGLLVGPLAGAIAGELVRTGNLEVSLRSGVGAFLGMLAGAVAQIALAGAMVGLFLWWAWRG